MKNSTRTIKSLKVGQPASLLVSSDGRVVVTLKGVVRKVNRVKRTIKISSNGVDHTFGFDSVVA